MILCSLPVFIIFCASSGLAEPIVEEINCYPYNPAPLSTITLIAGIYNNNSRIEEVRLIAQECMEDICFIDSENISMNYTYSCCMDFYEAELKLKQEDATQVKYHLVILNNKTWYKYETDYIYLKIKSDENPVDSNENSTPGFEILLVLSCIVMLLGKKLIRNGEK